ncbi:MAG TPA: hypothetical protein VIX73_12310 [Kofleriaceae bacterium]
MKAILASLILGSSSIAMASPAAPGVTVSSVSYGTPNVTVRDHRLDSAPYQSPAYSNWNDDDAYRAPIAQPVARPIYWRTGWHGQPMPAVYRPVTLAAGLRLPANSQTEIKVGGQQGAFTTLKLEATGGRSFIRQVYIMFENGQEQILRNVNRTLTGNDCFTIDLDGGRRQINRVIVYGALGQPGWRRAPGTFNLTAV